MRAIGPCLTSLLTLTACLGGGGGGGGGGGSPASFTGLNLALAANPAVFESTEYRQSGALEPIDASTLYAAGGTGTGVTVGIIDTGIDTSHPEFTGAIHPASVDLVRGGALGDGSGHGTAVAGLLGARRNGSAIHGMAFDADLLVVRADAPGSCPQGCLFNQSTLAAATDHAVANGARVLNFSLGEATSLANSFRQSLGAAAAADRVLVFAAGNGGGASPQQPALFATSGAARGTGIIVGAVDDSSVIADFSNRAGSAADVFIVAPGESLRTTALGGGTAVVSGTSTATPLVSGAAAALISAAPHLSAANVVAILLDSARDLGAPGTDSIYGRGMLDLAQALAPMGPLRVPEGVSTAAVARPLGNTRLDLGTAFGGKAPDVGPAMALDAFDRAYAVSLPTETARRSASALPDFLRRQHTDAPERLAVGGLSLDLTRAGLVDDRALFDDTDLAGLAATWQLDEALRVTASLGEPTRPGDPVALGLWQGRRGGDETASFVDLAAPASLELDAAIDPMWSVSLTLAGDPDGALERMTADRQPWTTTTSGYVEPKEGRLAAVGLTRGGADLGSWRIGLGVLDEADGPLGSTGSGALRAGEALTQFVDIAGQLRLAEGVQGFGRAALGRTATASDGGLLAEMGPLWSTSFELGIALEAVARTDDRLTFTLSQPLRVESGAAELDVPVARDLAGGITRSRRELDLGPDGREIDLEIGYGLALGGFADQPGRLQTAVMLRLAPDHDPEAAPELLLGLSYRLPF